MTLWACLPDPFRIRSLTDLPEYLKGRKQEESPMLTEAEEDLEALILSNGKGKFRRESTVLTHNLGYFIV
jgi:hypothetical protein